ncbi:MAG: hypothetical protein U0931_23870 [Vulcanimicrobiota bacterium]
MSQHSLPGRLKPAVTAVSGSPDCYRPAHAGEPTSHWAPYRPGQLAKTASPAWREDRETDTGGWSINGGTPYHSVAAFYAALMEAEPGSIRRLDLSGHSSPNWGGLSANKNDVWAQAQGGISTKNGKLELWGARPPKHDPNDIVWGPRAEYPDFAKLVGEKLAPGARVTFWGCHAGAGENSPAAVFSRTYPGTSVVGSTDATVNGGRDSMDDNKVIHPGGRWNLFREGKMKIENNAQPFYQWPE